MIQFQAPHYLWALFLLVVPILIHLFNFRRYRKVSFTNVRFLREINEQTSRQQKLRHLLILASRLLAVFFLVMIFCRPVLPGIRRGPLRTDPLVSIFIDNSFSMENQAGEGVLFDLARKRASEIVLAYPPSARFQILGADFTALQQRIYSRDEALDEIDRLRIGTSSRSVTEILSRQQDALNAAGGLQKDYYLLSDFQKSMLNQEVSMIADTSLSVRFLRFESGGTQNITVDSVWLESPSVRLNQPASLRLRLFNIGEEDAENVPIRFLLNGEQKSVASTAVPSNSSTEVSITFTVSQPGWQSGTIQIDDHPVQFDDSYYFSFEVREKIQVVELQGGRPSPYLKALFGSDSSFSHVVFTSGGVDYNAIPSADLVLLYDWADPGSGLTASLQKYLESGGTLVVFPDTLPNASAYQRLLFGDYPSAIQNQTLKIGRVSMKHPLFSFFKNSTVRERTDFPVSTRSFALSSGNRSGRLSLMEFENGSPFLSEYDRDGAKVYLFSVPLAVSWTSLPIHALFPPLLYNMAVQSLTMPSLAYVIGREVPALLRTNSDDGSAGQTLRMRNSANGTEWIPRVLIQPGGVGILPGADLKEAGVFDLVGQKGVLMKLAYNYERTESRLISASESDISNYLSRAGLTELMFLKDDQGDLSRQIRTMNEGTPLWKWCVYLALAFFLIETILVRYPKRT